MLAACLVLTKELGSPGEADARRFRCLAIRFLIANEQRLAGRDAQRLHDLQDHGGRGLSPPGRRGPAHAAGSDSPPGPDQMGHDF